MRKVCGQEYVCVWVWVWGVREQGLTMDRERREGKEGREESEGRKGRKRRWRCLGERRGEETS